MKGVSPAARRLEYIFATPARLVIQAGMTQMNTDISQSQSSKQI
jgi:hypothetical protein